MKIRSLTVLASTLMIVLSVGLARSQSSNAIAIEGPFARATPVGSNVGAGYMTITNKGAAADRLVSATSPVAGEVQVHEMTMQDGVSKMRALPGGLPIEAGKSTTLAPGGSHLMFMGLKAPLKQGDKVSVTLNFEKAGKVDVTLDVQSIGAQQPNDAAMPSDHMHKM